MIGIVVDGFGISHEPVLSFLSRARPRFTVVLNEKEKLANPAQQFTQVIFRNVNDDNLFNDPAFDAKHFTHNLAFGLTANVGLYLGNEPGDHNLPLLIEKTCDAMEVCIELNRSAFLFNFAVFHPPDSFYEVLRNHERFNRLYSRGNFWICGHEYFPSTIAQGLQDGAILRPLWFRLAQHYRIAFSEWGYARGYAPHAGWQGRISEDEYIRQLEIYVNNPDFKQHKFPFTVFIWNQWHDFEIMNAIKFQEKMIQLNKESIDMYKLTHLSWFIWNYRSGRGTQFSKLGSIDIRTTPIELLDLQAGWYKVNIPSQGISGVYMSQYGGEVGFTKV